MPLDSPYYTPDVPDDQKQAVIALAAQIFRKHRIDSAVLLLTDIDFPEELVINATNLHLRDSLPPESSALFPEMGFLESLVSLHSNILIIPLWKVDLYETIHGNQAAAVRWMERIGRRLPDVNRFTKMAREQGVPAPQARLDLMTSILLQAVAHRDEPLPVWSFSNPAPLQHPDGTPEAFVPSQLNPWAFRQWAEFQTIENTKRRLDGLSIMLSVLIDDSGSEGGPNQLGWYPPLPPLRRGGAPTGPRYFGRKPDLLLKVKTAMDDLQAQGVRPTEENVAKVVLQRLGRQGRDGEHSNPRLALMRDAHYWGISSWDDLKAQANDFRPISEK